MKKLIILVTLLIAIGCKEKQLNHSNDTNNTEAPSRTWNYENAKQYNRSQFEKDKWDMKILKSDLEYIDNDPWPTQPPISEIAFPVAKYGKGYNCLLYTSPSPRDQRGSRMPSSA